MKVILLQTDIRWADPAANVAYMDKLISAHAQGTDLFVLPEMFSTGFCTSPEGIAESSDSATLQWMKQKAADAIVPLPEVFQSRKMENSITASTLCILTETCSGTIKSICLRMEEKTNTIRPDRKRVIVDFRGVRFLLEVCYDLRFPVWSRNRGDYDAAVYVASWPRPEWKPGRLCCVPVPSRTSAMYSG